jgi:hypothetical protein
MTKSRMYSRADSAAVSGSSESVTQVSTSASSAKVESPTTPHLVWSATTTTRRAEDTKLRLVSASARFGVESPASGASPWVPRNSRSKWSERIARSAIGPTSESEGVRTPPVSTTVVPPASPCRWARSKTSATRTELVTTVN